MVRRETKNITGISRVSGIPYHEAWVTFNCVNCKEINHVLIGKQLITPVLAYQDSVWKCDKCNFIHSKESDLPFDNWEDNYIDADSSSTQRFWQGFFRISTEKPESYWKQCNVCARILPFSAFDKHKNWGPLERQMECRGCKAAINAILNPKRTKEQLHESSVRRRIADLFLEGQNESINQNDLFKRFSNQCFKTKISLDINDRSSWAIDHILPSKWLYPLTIENAALLSKEANENKSEKWPSKFYTNKELVALAKITGANLELLSSKKPIRNEDIDVNRGVDRYLEVREQSDLNKKIMEMKKILQVYDLIEKLNSKNRKILGL